MCGLVYFSQPPGEIAISSRSPRVPIASPDPVSGRYRNLSRSVTPATSFVSAVSITMLAFRARAREREESRGSVSSYACLQQAARESLVIVMERNECSLPSSTIFFFALLSLDATWCRVNDCLIDDERTANDSSPRSFRVRSAIRLSARYSDVPNETTYLCEMKSNHFRGKTDSFPAKV